jgi:hypothetical protein
MWGSPEKRIAASIAGKGQMRIHLALSRNADLAPIPMTWLLQSHDVVMLQKSWFATP